MLALARAFRPAARGLVDVRVLKGIPLPDFEDGTELFALDAEVGEDEQVTVALRGSAGRVHYRARVRTESYAGLTHPDPGTLAPWATRDVYARELFHGPALQVLQDVRAADAGMRARLRPSAELGWALPRDATLDVAAVDGAIQLAALWTRRLRRSASLPTGLLELRVHASASVPAARAVLLPVRATAASTVSDVRLLDAQGGLLVELLGLELHVLPAGEYPAAPRIAPEAG
jgi:hypothetical protein